MNALALLATLPSPDTAIGLIVWVAIAAVVIVAVALLVKWACAKLGVTIPQPVWIVAGALLAIAAIIIIARLFTMLV